TEVLLDRVASNAHLPHEGVLLRGLLDALAGAIEHPTVIWDPQAIVFDPAHGEERAAMCAAWRNEVHGATFASVQGEVLAHHTKGLRTPRGEILRAVDRVPKRAQIPSSKSPRTGMRKIRQIYFRGALVAD